MDRRSMRFTYYQGKYQMYWWGKAISEDLVHYQEISPKVMTGDDGSISYFTGSTLIDKENTAGFGKNAYVAAYTIFNKQNKNQSQGISYSLDGETCMPFRRENGAGRRSLLAVADNPGIPWFTL